MNAKQSGRSSGLPWVLALVGLAVPMIGSGSIGWPFVVGWLVLLVLLWWIRPLADIDRRSRIVAGIGALVLLALLSTFGGLYLLPAMAAWLVLVARGHDAEPLPNH
jgi:hypothetical protein